MHKRLKILHQSTAFSLTWVFWSKRRKFWSNSKKWNVRSSKINILDILLSHSSIDLTEPFSLSFMLKSIKNLLLWIFLLLLTIINLIVMLMSYMTDYFYYVWKFWILRWNWGGILLGFIGVWLWNAQKSLYAVYVVKIISVNIRIRFELVKWRKFKNFAIYAYLNISGSFNSDSLWHLA